MFHQKDLERRCVAAVAHAHGCTAEDESGQWPDGWMLDGAGGRIPVEVVSAFPEPNGCAWARAWCQARAQAQRLEEETGARTGWAVSDGIGAVFTADDEIPVRTKPCNPIAGVFAAIDAKAKKYGPGESRQAILVVHHVHWPFLLEQNYLKTLAEHADRTGAPFREIWIVNEYGDPAQQVPLRSRDSADSELMRGPNRATMSS
jgi:hypothetical protein